MIHDNSLETIFVLIRQLESALRGLKEMRAFVTDGAEQERLESMIDKNETKLKEIKRKVIQ